MKKKQKEQEKRKQKYAWRTPCRRELELLGDPEGYRNRLAAQAGLFAATFAVLSAALLGWDVCLAFSSHTGMHVLYIFIVCVLSVIFAVFAGNCAGKIRAVSVDGGANVYVSECAVTKAWPKHRIVRIAGTGYRRTEFFVDKEYCHEGVCFLLAGIAVGRRTVPVGIVPAKGDGAIVGAEGGDGYADRENGS